MILVKVAAGLVIELGPGAEGTLNRLSVRLAEGISSSAVSFEVAQSASGRLLVRPLELVEAAVLVSVLGVVLGHESAILAEVRKYVRS